MLLASIAFYGFWRIEFAFLIAFSAFVDFYFSLKIHDENRSGRRILWLFLSLGINLGLLGYFKYTYFVTENIAALGSLMGKEWYFSPGTIVLPLGISFYTFLSISYTLDVYRRQFVPIRNFWTYLTYVMFWPHMIAGPILRAKELISQILSMQVASPRDIYDGIRQILAGLFLKVVLADQLAPWIDEAFATSPNSLGGLDVWTMAFAFGLQIYFDFAGYSLIAIGSASLLGVRFPENFNWPYLATSPRDFWKRWHITLSAWIRDYLYLPLCGRHYRDSSQGGIDIQTTPNSLSLGRGISALFATWFIMGLWHGAGWRFAFWGIWHATLILIYRTSLKWLPDIREPFSKIAGWSLTLPLIMLGWIPFRAPTLESSLSILARVLDTSSYRGLAFRENFYLLVFVFTASMLLAWLINQARNSLPERAWVMQVGEVCVLSIMLFAVFIFLRPVNEFIYFQF